MQEYKVVVIANCPEFRTAFRRTITLPFVPFEGLWLHGLRRNDAARISLVTWHVDKNHFVCALDTGIMLYDLEKGIHPDWEDMEVEASAMELYKSGYYCTKMRKEGSA